MDRPSADPADPSAAAPFAWPPRRGLPVALDSGLPARLHGPRPAPAPADRSAWHHFESAFLDLSAPPLRHRAREADWLPDSSDAYCQRCGRSVGSATVSPDGCPDCAGVRFAWDRLVRLGEYTGPLRTWIHEVKFTRWRRLGIELGERLGWALVNAAERDPQAQRLQPVLLPVPDHPIRRIWRGIDHTAVIAAGVARTTGWPLWQPLRRRFGRSQLSNPASERAANVARSYGIRKGARPLQEGFLLVVLDDVITTGATMRCCCRLAASAAGDKMDRRGSPVWAACLARAELGRGDGRAGSSPRRARRLNDP